MNRIIALLIGMVWISGGISARETNGTSPGNAFIYINQVGYLPHAPKYALVENGTGTQFNVIDSLSGSVVFQGTLSDHKLWEPAGKQLRQANFTPLQKAGYYYVESDGTRSASFCIGEDAWEDVTHSLMKSYYYQRCSYALDEKYAGQWKRNAGHPDIHCILHPSAGNGGDVIASPGGWYDAGDYGKYVVNAGISTGTLLMLAEQFPDIYPDGSLNIAESGNGKSDLLDELRYELDWLLTMQDKDGGVFFKLTTKSFCGMVMPGDDTMERYIIGKTTASTLNFAAVMAMSGRIFRDYDEVFAARCIESAKKGWIWATTHPVSYFTNPSDILTGEYGDKKLADEFLWAATELFLSTNEAKYSDYIAENKSVFQFDDSKINVASWPSVSALAVIDLALHPDVSLPKIHAQCRNTVLKYADALLKELTNHPARIPNMSFIWGSCGDLGNRSLYLIYAHQLTGEKKYLSAAMEIADYFLGKNVTGYSFITGFGSKRVMHPHHRPSVADGVTDPVPGLVAGGPNGGLQDKGQGVVYPNVQPPLAYVDVEESYASNEVAINWNAPVVALFAYINHQNQAGR